MAGGATCGTHVRGAGTTTSSATTMGTFGLRTYLRTETPSGWLLEERRLRPPFRQRYALGPLWLEG